MSEKNFYLTTAIDYVNGAPHIGHAIDYLLSDTYARYMKASGNEVRFQAGTLCSLCHRNHPVRYC